jgi:hypothetical protein
MINKVIYYTSKQMELITIAFIFIILLIIHHIYIHDNLEFPQRIFEVKDVSNHETWEVALAAFIVGIIVSK